MTDIFPGPIKNLPQADIPIKGLKAYLSQADTHQILFMEFSKNVELPEHSHESQVGVVLEGKCPAVCICLIHIRISVTSLNIYLKVKRDR